MDWLEVRVITDGEGAEAIAECLRPYAYNDGVVIEQLGDESSPEPNVLETAVTVKIYIPKEDDTPAKRRKIEETLHYLSRLYPIPPPTFHLLKEQDWANAWKIHYKPFRIGQKIWIQPSWIELDQASDSDLKADDIILTLDPGMAFGTGLHPTTQMCIQFMEEAVKIGDQVLDVGTGSGILSIAAAKLGAAHIVAFDTDELAVRAAQENVQINRVAEKISIFQGTLDQQLVKPWDMVIVNILAPIIIRLLQQDQLMDYVAKEGVLILSGIIESQLEEVKTAVQQAKGKIIQIRKIRDWVSLMVAPL